MQRRVFIVTGLTLGDEGKGATVDYLARLHRAALVVRYQGGPQAAHHVITPDGRFHCFAQFGSGTFAGSRTLLASEMVIEPENLLREADALAAVGIRDPLKLVTIDPDCIILTPFHKMICQLREIARGNSPRGTCGMGIGEAVRDREAGAAITFRDVLEERDLEIKLHRLAKRKLTEAKRLVSHYRSREADETYAYFLERGNVRVLAESYRAFARSSDVSFEKSAFTLARACGLGNVILEGAQGALLHRYLGCVPHVTQSDPTAMGAKYLLPTVMRQGSTIEKVGVMRPYAHRHGVGPLPTEDAALATSILPDHNMSNRWQGQFRLGWLDLPLVRYGLRLNDGVDWISLTNLDRLTGIERIRVATTYNRGGHTHQHLMPPQHVYPHPLKGNTLTSWMLASEPTGWRTYDGWHHPIHSVRQLNDLPASAQKLIEDLESTAGLGTPIRLISVGPSADQKFFHRTRHT